jgi:hypothetical protein
MTETNERDPVVRTSAVEVVCWVFAVALMSAVFFAALSPVQATEAVAWVLGVGR